MAWIILSIAAAGFQTLRFMLQKILSMGALSPAGATYARFIFAVPFIGGATAAYLMASGQAFPGLPVRFWLFSLSGGLAQILATWAVVTLFSRRNFAVGITFKKTEVLQAAVLGFIILGDRISALGLGAILLGMVGVVLLSTPPGQKQAPRLTGGFFRNGAAGLGLLSGALFAISGVAYRGAALSVPSTDIMLRAMVTLLMVSLSQSIFMGIWLRFREPGSFGNVLKSWRKSVWMGMAGMAGSLCWFTAFNMKNAAYVFAVGQVEVIFSILVASIFFHEHLSRREATGIALVTLSILGLVAFA